MAIRYVLGAFSMLLSRIHVIRFYPIGILGYALLISVWVIWDFSSPTYRIDDLNHFTFMHRFFMDHVSFLPYPKLNLQTDYFLYPYGIKAVIMPWGFERDLFIWLLDTKFGTGPWPQLYMLVSILVTAFGAYFLLKRIVTAHRALVWAILLISFNFYPYIEFPSHLNISIVHWTILGVITDFILSYHLVQERPPPVDLVFFRFFCVVASFGLDLGYVMGFGLASFVLHLSYFALIYTRKIFRSLSSTDHVISFFKEPFVPTKKETLHALFILAGALVLAFFYVPWIFQLKSAADAYPQLPHFAGGSSWSNPFALLFPILPGFEEPLAWVKHFSADPLGTSLDVRPGLFLLLAAAAGIHFGRDYRGMFVPLYVLFGLCLIYHPYFIPTLKLFPWFEYNRVQGRFTIILPTMLLLFTLGVRWTDLSRRKWFCVLLAVLMATEFATGMAKMGRNSLRQIDGSFLSYMKILRSLPGNAVLDWPFCVFRGRSVVLGYGTRSCPIKISLLMPMGWNGQYHRKKVIGQYLTRYPESEPSPVRDAGWDLILAGTAQRRCFTKAEWNFFDKFFTYGDFSSINLYLRYLPQKCIDHFVARYGPSIAHTEIPIAGPILLLPKPDHLRKMVDENKARSLVYKEPLASGTVNLMRSDLPPGSYLMNLAIPERDDRGRTIRNSQDREIRYYFSVANPRHAAMSLDFYNFVNNQTITIHHNKKLVQRLENIRDGERRKILLNFTLDPGRQEFIIRFARYLWVWDAFIAEWRKNGILGFLNIAEVKNTYNSIRKRAISVYEFNLSISKGKF
ncbi:hypothetical protein ACFLQ0_00980 [Nitrospinota bacterium]